jgi:hypothetical protein
MHLSANAPGTGWQRDGNAMGWLRRLMASRVSRVSVVRISVVRISVVRISVVRISVAHE